MSTIDHQHLSSPPREPRAIAKIGVADRGTLRLASGIAWVLWSCFGPSAMAQQSTPLKSQPQHSEASGLHSGVEQIRNPRLRAVLQSNGALNRTTSSQNDRPTAAGFSSSVRTGGFPQATRGDETIGPPEPSTVRRASYEEQILALRGEDSSGTSEKSTEKAVIASSGTQVDDETPTLKTASPPTGDVPEALQKTPESKPRETFLDLTGQTTSASTESEKPIGEHGAELSIEASPQQVLYRAVAWLVIALCLFSLAALGVRKWQRQRGLLPTNSSSSRVVETLSLGPGRAVSLIEMSGHRALVAFDASGIRHMVLAPRSFDEELVSEQQDDNTASLPVSSEPDLQRRTAM